MAAPLKSRVLEITAEIHRILPQLEALKKRYSELNLALDRALQGVEDEPMPPAVGNQSIRARIVQFFSTHNGSWDTEGILPHMPDVQPRTLVATMARLAAEASPVIERVGSGTYQRTQQADDQTIVAGSVAVPAAKKEEGPPW